jgi:hypothetical protein
MKPITRTLTGLGILFALATGSPAAAQTDRGWKVELTGLSTRSTTASFDGSESSAGFGLGIEYQFSPRLGVEVDVPPASSRTR